MKAERRAKGQERATTRSETGSGAPMHGGNGGVENPKKIENKAVLN